MIITTTSRPATRRSIGFRTHIAAARETGLPLVIHTREADDDTAHILEQETGQGAFPAVLHCFTGGAGSRPPRHCAWAFHLLHRHPDLQEFQRRCAPLPRSCRRTAFWSKPTRPYLAPGRFRGKRNEPAYVVETAKVLAETRGVSLEIIAQQTTENFFRLFAKVPRPNAAAA